MAVSFSDIAQLQLDEPDQIKWDEYQDAQAIPAPPPEGIYKVQAPGEIKFSSWSRDGKTHLIIDMKETKALTIAEGEFKGRKLFYPFVSTRKYAKRMGSQFHDYLRSFGVSAQPQTHAENASLAQATANRIGTAQVKWEGYCSDCGSTTVEGQASFGGKSSVPCPNCGKAVSARAKIDRFLVG